MKLTELKPFVTRKVKTWGPWSLEVSSFTAVSLISLGMGRGTGHLGLVTLHPRDYGASKTGYKMVPTLDEFSVYTKL